MRPRPSRGEVTPQPSFLQQPLRRARKGWTAPAAPAARRFHELVRAPSTRECPAPARGRAAPPGSRPAAAPVRALAFGPGKGQVREPTRRRLGHQAPAFRPLADEKEADAALAGPLQALGGVQQQLQPIGAAMRPGIGRQQLVAAGAGWRKEGGAARTGRGRSPGRSPPRAPPRAPAPPPPCRRSARRRRPRPGRLRPLGVTWRAAPAAVAARARRAAPARGRGSRTRMACRASAAPPAPAAPPSAASSWRSPGPSAQRQRRRRARIAREGRRAAPRGPARCRSRC
jgi:hypothetical protein